MPTAVTAAVIRAYNAPFTIEEFELNDPIEDEVLVRVHAVGVCHTDVKAAEGGIPVPTPIVLGHEGAGIVERVGSRVTRLRPGDHVVLCADFCGHCSECHRGRMVYCEEARERNFTATGPGQPQPYAREGGRVHGMFFGQSSFGTYAIAHENNAVKVRDDVPIETLGPLGCAVQTGVGGIINVLKAEAGSSIVIFGAGSVGQSALLGAVLAGCTTIVAVDVVDHKLDVAESVGATHRVRGDAGDLGAALRAIRPRGFDYAFDTTAHSPVLETAVASLATGGTLGVVSASRETRVSFPAQSFFQKGLTVRGMVQGESVPEFIPRLVDLFAAGRLPFDKLITRYPLAAINEAVDHVHRGSTVKPLLLTKP